MRSLRRKAIWGIGSAGTVLVIVAVVTVIAAARPHSQSGGASDGNDAEPSEADAKAVTVKTIRPKRDPSFSLSVKQPATVAPYYHSELDAQVAGRVEFIRKAAGSPVKAGELLVKIAAPDLEQEVLLKEAVVQQRRRELELAQKSIKVAQAAEAVAKSNIPVKEAEVDAADAMRIYREKEFKRLSRLIEDNATMRQIVEEHEYAYLAAKADKKKAEMAVRKAKSDLAEAEAKSEAANADVTLKDALIGVARKDRDKAQAQADYAQVKSLFDGRIKHRHVDPGSFVRIGDPVLTVERTDIVTVTMKVPDTFAPLVSDETEAVIEMSGLPGLSIQGKVTRFSPSLETKTNDRTMLVEVDLFNGTERDYERFLGRERAKKAPFEDLKEGPLPLVPKVTGPNAGEFHRLLPGMYGEMRLVFRKLTDAYLVPSDAIVRDGGTPYLFLAKEGKAHRVQVEIQVDDQKLAKVIVLEKTGGRQVKRSLTDKDVIIYSNLGELTEGEPVAPIAVDWQP